MTVPLNSLFKVEYGNKFDLNKMNLVEGGRRGINFVGRASRHHGVSAQIERVAGIPPFSAGCITVALGGSKLLASFVQLEEFYTAQNVAVLTPLIPMNLAQKLFVCLAIRHNRFKYSAFGREANRTLRTLLIPSLEEFPGWVSNVSSDLSVDNYLQPAAEMESRPTLSSADWSLFSLQTLFEIKKGTRLTQSKMEPGPVPFISAIDKNNGVRQKISASAKHPSNVLTVSYNGSVGEVFYQPEPFFASDDVNVLYPKFELNETIGIFLCAIIRKEAYRFSYGRKWTVERMRSTTIALPQVCGMPDWEWVEKFVQTIPGSRALVGGVIDEPLIR